MARGGATGVKVLIGEGLVVGPDDVLVIRGPERAFEDGIFDELNRALTMHGLDKRTLIIGGAIEMAKVEKADA